MHFCSQIAEHRIMNNQDDYQINQHLHISTMLVGNEQEKILIIDDLAQTPNALVAYAAQENGFDIHKGPCNFYPGLKLKAPTKYSDNLMPVIKKIIATHYDEISPDWEMHKAECAMSLITIEPENLRVVQTTPHFDTANPYQFAVLLYLCNENHGGTAFYRHKATGYETIRRNIRKEFEDIYFKEIETSSRPKAYFTESDDYFEKIGIVNPRFNRMVIYRSCLLHAAHIQPSSVNPDPRTGRLTINSFVAFQEN